MENFKLALAKNNGSFFEYDIICNNELARLRPLKTEDMAAFARFISDYAVWKYFAIKMHQLQDMNDYIDDAVQQRKLGLRYHFAIEDQKTGEIVGSTAFGNYSPKDSRIEIGWSWVETSFQGSGINKNAKFLLLNFAFNYLNMERVEFKTDVLNVRASGALIKIGATEEGVLRSHTLMPDERRRDTVYYSILKDEWETKIWSKNFSDHSSDVQMLMESCNSVDFFRN
ncbi:GNAT family N-acetyltransferase [Candidatus Tisiphia endosymbiont of Nedyus quadrimaculatus]|uniref:GNAT family N-acetyltransferase n=1 Tax=Candidatus Tisiphia endosymbiont of Nedyus quadrimaculatus TaxID=3139332 RepID=UPI00345E4230